MYGQPLKPFPGFPSPSSLLPGGMPTGTVFVWVLVCVCAFWAVYTLVAIYHWYRYSHASWVAFPAIVIHLFVSLAIVAFILSGIFKL